MHFRTQLCPLFQTIKGMISLTFWVELRRYLFRPERWESSKRNMDVFISFSFETSVSRHYIDLSRLKRVMFCISLRCRVPSLQSFLRKSLFLLKVTPIRTQYVKVIRWHSNIHSTTAINLHCDWHFTMVNRISLVLIIHQYFQLKSYLTAN